MTSACPHFSSTGMQLISLSEQAFPSACGMRGSYVLPAHLIISSLAHTEILIAVETVLPAMILTTENA